MIDLSIYYSIIRYQVMCFDTVTFFDFSFFNTIPIALSFFKIIDFRRALFFYIFTSPIFKPFLTNYFTCWINW